MLIGIRNPQLSDEASFLEAMQKSQKIHYPWVKAPLTSQEFKEYIEYYQKPNQISYLVCNGAKQITGVININEIVLGLFQSAYLGYFVVAEYMGKGYMSAGLKLVLNKAFTELKLHRLEANIQPNNTQSIQLIKANGFQLEGYSPKYLKINGAWRDHERWAILYEDWLAINQIFVNFRQRCVTSSR